MNSEKRDALAYLTYASATAGILNHWITRTTEAELETERRGKSSVTYGELPEAYQCVRPERWLEGSVNER